MCFRNMFIWTLRAGVSYKKVLTMSYIKELRHCGHGFSEDNVANSPNIDYDL